MRRVHRNQAARLRMEQLGLPEELVDTDGDGVITEEELEAAIEQVDTNKDGEISQEELRAALALLGRIANELGIK